MDEKKKTSDTLCCAPMDDEDESNVRPLLIGRVLRILAGAGTLWLALHLGLDQLGPWGFGSLLFLAVSFLLSGLMAMPGCEIFAIPNLLFARNKRKYFICPVWTPFDRAEKKLKDKGGPGYGRNTNH